MLRSVFFLILKVNYFNYILIRCTVKENRFLHAKSHLKSDKFHILNIFPYRYIH